MICKAPDKFGLQPCYAASRELRLRDRGSHPAVDQPGVLPGPGPRDGRLHSGAPAWVLASDCPRLARGAAFRFRCRARGARARHGCALRSDRHRRAGRGPGALVTEPCFAAGSIRRGRRRWRGRARAAGSPGASEGRHSPPGRRPVARSRTRPRQAEDPHGGTAPLTGAGAAPTQAGPAINGPARDRTFRLCPAGSRLARLIRPASYRVR